MWARFGSSMGFAVGALSALVLWATNNLPLAAFFCLLPLLGLGIFFGLFNWCLTTKGHPTFRLIRAVFYLLLAFGVVLLVLGHYGLRGLPDALHQIVANKVVAGFSSGTYVAKMPVSCLPTPPSPIPDRTAVVGVVLASDVVLAPDRAILTALCADVYDRFIGATWLVLLFALVLLVSMVSANMVMVVVSSMQGGTVPAPSPSGDQKAA